jgi:ABC-type molybdate transport system permease subunit
LASILGFGSFLIGCFFSFSPNLGEHRFGNTLAVAGAIIIAGLLISVAITGRSKMLK